jgi:hypothetical protein
MIPQLSIPPTSEELHSLFTYNPITGELRWKIKPNSLRQIGELAGYTDDRGRRCVGINRRYYFATNIIWAMQTGRWPTHLVDHKDTYGPREGIGNRWENLREATGVQNGANKRIALNNKSGYPGVKHQKNGKWRAVIKKNGKWFYLGSYVEKSDAINAKKSAEVKMFGEFAPQHPEAK